MLKITSRAVKEISEGELLQIEKSRKLDITEEVFRYYQEENGVAYCCLLCLWSRIFWSIWRRK